QARAELFPTGLSSDLITADAAPQPPRDATGANPKEHVMTSIRRTSKFVIALRPLLAAAVAAATFVVPSYASAGPAPVDPPGDGTTSAATYAPAIGGRTDEQFWGEATWLNPLSGLNLDRSSVGH